MRPLKRKNAGKSNYAFDFPALSELVFRDISEQLTTWRWRQSAANPSPGHIPYNREIYWELAKFPPWAAPYSHPRPRHRALPAFSPENNNALKQGINW
jgi:hypothetical protein